VHQTGSASVPSPSGASAPRRPVAGFLLRPLGSAGGAGTLTPFIFVFWTLSRGVCLPLLSNELSVVRPSGAKSHNSHEKKGQKMSSFSLITPAYKTHNATRLTPVVSRRLAWARAETRSKTSLQISSFILTPVVCSHGKKTWDSSDIT